MGKGSLIDRLRYFFTYKLPQYFCRHEKIILACKSDELVDGYCDYAGMCKKCGKGFRVIVEER